MPSIFRSEFEQFYELTSADIYAFCAAMNFEPHWQQCELFDLVQLESTCPSEERKKEIAVKSGQGPGKTAASVIIGLWRTWRHVNAITFITAPTQHQVKDVWLAECRRWVMQAHPFIKKVITVTKTRVVFNNQPTWGIWTVPASRPESFAGRHEKHMTIICDEASGIEREIMQTIQGTLTNDDSLWLTISNPTTRDCYFYEQFTKNRDRIHCLTFNAEETPESEHFTRDAQQKIAEEYGIESDVYAVRVKGEFPGIDPKSLMGIDDLEACARYSKLEGILEHPCKQFGIDIARYGSDESVIFQRSGMSIIRWQRFVKWDPVDVLREACRWQHESGWRDDECSYVFDASGMGEGVAFYLHEEGKDVFEFKGAAKASDSQYANKITEAYFGLAKLVRQRCIHIPNDNILLQQCTTRQYLFNPKGKLMLEPKDAYVKRIAKGNEGPSTSPDRADALALCFYSQLESDGWVTTKDDYTGDEEWRRAVSKGVGARVRA